MLIASQPIAWYPRREPRPLDDDDRAAVADGDAELAGRLDEDPPQVGAVRVGGGDVRRLRPVVERVRAAARPVDELVADDELPEREVGPERAGCAWADDPADAQLAQRPQVRAKRDAVRRELVAAPVPRQERDALPADVADHDRGRRLSVRGLDLHLLGVVEQRGEPTAAEDPDHES
jgi:hypothetical protein